MSKEDGVIDITEAENIQPVEGADISPFPKDIFIRFQSIYLGKGSRGNYRFMLYPDGRFFLSETQKLDLPYPKRFDQPYPGTPSKIFSKEEISELKELIINVKILDLADGYVSTRKVEGGAMMIFEIQLTNQYKKIIIDRCKHMLVEKVRKKIMEFYYK